MKYKLRREVGVQADVVADELKRINEKYQGVDPRDVVTEAEPVDAPLHPAFTWNDQKAAYRYRLYEARNLIRAVHVVDEATGEDLGCEFVRVTTGGDDEDDDSAQTKYLPRATVVADKDLFESAIRGLIEKLKGAERSLSDLEKEASRLKGKPKARAVRQASQAVRTAHEALAEAV